MEVDKPNTPVAQLVSQEAIKTKKIYPNAETYCIKRARNKEAKIFNLQELPYVTSIEFPMKFNPKYSKRENINKLIFKCGGNEVVSKYIDDLEEEQKVQEFKLEKSIMIKKRLKEKKDARKYFKKKQRKDRLDGEDSDANMDASDDEESNDEKDSEDEDESEEESDAANENDEESDNDGIKKKKENKRRKRKKKDVITKLHMQPAIGDEALMMYLNKTENSGSNFFNEKPILGRPTRDQKIVIKIRLEKNKTIKDNPDFSLLEKLQQKNIVYSVEPVAIIDSSIKFRVTSDAQFTLGNNETAQEYRRSILDLDFNEMHKFINSIPEMDSKPWFPIDEEKNFYELIPPVKTFISEIPFEYEFKQNKLAGKIASSKSLYVPTYQVQVSSLDAEVPTGPSEVLKEKWQLAHKYGKYPHFLNVETSKEFYSDLKDMIETLNKKFDSKPIWLKKHLQGVVVDKISMCGSVLKYALPFVAYRIMKGPWIHSYCKYGVDPKSDSKYAKYQVEQFRIAHPIPTDKFKNYTPCPSTYISNIEGDIDSRFFLTGNSIPWYSTYTMEVLMKEPHVKDLMENSQYLETCDAETGWFNELDTWKRKRIVKYILDCLYQGITEFSEDKIKIYKNMPSTKIYTPESHFVAKSKDLMTTNRERYILNDENNDEDGEADMYDAFGSDNDDDFDEKLLGNINLEEASFDDIIKRIGLQNNEIANEVKESFDQFIKL
ncbi:hypothetical protein QEN19_003972 [Hanseniaspora menglaensis]